MKLNAIRLCNFRQFYGQTPEIVLAAGERNTTIVHGNNGAGKTTLLNAFTWVLYNKFTAAFASPDLLINKRAITEANLGTSVDCWVEVRFEHEHKRYQVKRSCFACRDKEGRIQYSQSKFFMYVAGDDGRWYIPSEDPVQIIQGILPESLHQYFFFDGERIDRIFRDDAQKGSIAEDTKELLGVKVWDRAIEHLKKVKRVLQDELKEIGDLQVRKLLQEEARLEQERDRLVERQQEIIQELARQEEAKRFLNQRMLEFSSAKELQQVKVQLESQEELMREKLGQTRTLVKQLISSRGYTVLLSEAIAQFQSLVSDLRAKGELPAGIEQQFVRDLLQRQRCLCGTALIEGTSVYQNVQAWLERAGTASVEEAVLRLETQANQIEQQGLQFWQEVDRQQTNLHQWRSELGKTENRLDEIKQKLRTYPDEEIQQQQKRLDEVEETIRTLTLEQGANGQQIQQLAREIEAKAKQASKHKLKEEKQSLLQRRIQATQDAIARLIEMRSRLERQFRLSLERRVQEIFSAISFTPYIPRLKANYELTLVENTSGVAVPVAASTGENQILSLSFIGGIIDRVRAWSQKNAIMGPDSSTFPIVMDSPFGSLDETYRRQVARTIPQLANQLTILVTQTQWRGEVEQEVADFIGREYVLVYHSPKPDCEEETLERGGIEYSLVRHSPNQFEYTEVVAIRRETE